MPPDHRRFDPNHDGMRPEFGEAYANFNPANKQGLGLIGESGEGKTHVALWCLKKCIDPGFPFLKIGLLNLPGFLAELESFLKISPDSQLGNCCAFGNSCWLCFFWFRFPSGLWLDFLGWLYAFARLLGQH